MLKRLFLLLVVITLILLFSGMIQKVPMKTDEFIHVEIKGSIKKPGIYRMKLGDNIEDLFKLSEPTAIADLSSFSLKSRLYNDQLIVIPERQSKMKISINSADLEQLCSLPGIGQKTAQKIIDYRNKVGSFLSLEDIKNVSGIGKVKYERIKELITL